MEIFPDLADGVSKWHQVEPPTFLQEKWFQSYYGYPGPTSGVSQRYIRYPQIAKRESGELYLADPGEMEFYEVQSWASFQRARQTEGLIKVPVCTICAEAGIERLGLERYEASQQIRFRCPCCLNFTLRSRSEYEICYACFWEDDGDEDLDEVSGPNHITLREGRANFQAFGACDERCRQFVRPLRPHHSPKFHE